MKTDNSIQPASPIPAQNQATRLSLQLQRMTTAIAMAIIMTLTACPASGDPDDDDDGNTSVQTGTYTGEKDGTKYTLKISKGSNSSDSSAGNNYELTASSKKSAGVIIYDEDGLLSLQPSNSSSVFFVTVHQKNISSIYEPITWNDGSTSRAPGVFPGNFPYIPDYNFNKSYRIMSASIVYRTLNMGSHRKVWEEANNIFASTTPDYLTFGTSKVGTKEYYWGKDEINGNWFTVCPTNAGIPNPYYFGKGPLPDLNERIFPDREIAEKTCSVYEHNGWITAYYRCIIFLETNQDGEVTYEITSFSDKAENYMPPPGYTQVDFDCDGE
jgi:hypothetical protein